MRSLLLTTLSLGIIATCAIAGTMQNSHDVYIVIYATYQGKTGHAGIAVDKYKIVVREEKWGDTLKQKYDTVKTGELEYFDLWPSDDYFTASRTGKDIPGIYYKLPANSFDEISINSLVDRGIPHKENYPCDGLLVLNTTAGADHALIQFLNKCITANRPFNGRKFNCTDFVINGLEYLLHRKIRVREFIPFAFSSTPNKLYRNLKLEPFVTVLKNADAKTRGSFISQRIIYKLFKH